MPRGGDNDDANTEEGVVAKDLYYQELSEQIIIMSDTDDDVDDVTLEETELLFDSEDDINYDVEASSSETDELIDDTSDDDEEPLDPIIIDPLGTETEERLIPKFLSPHHLTTTLPSNLMHLANMVLQAARRSLVAGARAILVENVDEKMEVEDDTVEEEEEGSYRRPVVRTLVGKTVFVLGEMYHAAKTTSEVEDGEKSDGGSKKRTHRRRRRKQIAAPSRRRHRSRRKYTTSPTEVVCNGGGMEPHNSSNKHALLNLARQHNIHLHTENDTDVLSQKYDSILLNSQTPLSTALQKSNSDARFLICYISKKKKGTNNTKKSDSIALSSLLSPEVVKSINRRPLGKKQSDTTGSYYVWIMNGDDGAQVKEIDVAMKRLKVKPPTSNSKKSSSNKKKKEDGPILAIFYPATTVDSSGKLKVTPRLLAQHHCHPPPSSPEVIMNWANTIRKRHIREFAKLQHDRKEMKLFKERTDGYKESMKEDRAREEREERELQVKKEEEEKERLRKEKLERRRQELLDALPEEAEAGSEGVITIALRFGDGSRDQRRFVAEDTSVNDVFNWVDATHGLEREKIELSTMNGSKTFAYVEEEDDDDEERENISLDEAGLGKMTALRVTEIVEEVDNGEDEEDGESESSDEE